MTAIGNTLNLKKPYLIFLGDVDDIVTAKTGCGIRDWAPDIPGDSRSGSCRP